ncbi:MAG: helix-turn-helix transcriptional regulator [Candidatus Pacebacteria bacterium]|jgi:DNA-binding XRE family transcriptional regulator|nr:helix-turn-helix transcriptional regulator [Candidatus Paceibacterota bacterium]MDD4994503.1 helix-turn-helix transcriptional regulator [Candidatus Paceibacterota bacterium]MDD5535278.1 helix-turn-helix transcriptional regulator [Candidatus Paceibacterota bacterium]
MKQKHKKIIYPSFERYLAKEMEDEVFRKAYEEESRKLKIAYQILLLRKRKKMSQAELAKKIGTKQSNIARMETGQQNFSIDMLQKIAQVFNRKLKISFIK